MPAPIVTPQQLTDWLARGQLGDEAACRSLFEHYSPNVLRLCLGLLGSRADAEEVTQDSFVYALSRLHNYDPAKSAFSSWLYTIALSRCRNKRRRKWLTLLPLDGLHTERPVQLERQVETLLESRGVRRQMWDALQSLPPRLQEALVLRFLGELRYAEVARILGCNPKTAESRVRLGLRAMRHALRERGIDGQVELTEQWVW